MKRDDTVRIRIKRATHFPEGNKNYFFGDIYVAARNAKGRKVWRRSEYWFKAESVIKPESGAVRDSTFVLFGPSSSLTFVWNNDDKNYFCVQNGITGKLLTDLLPKFISTEERVTHESK